MASTFIIAEAGVNHNGELSMARQLIDVAVDSGADAVKFQTFKADSLVSRQARPASYQKGYTSQYDLLNSLELSSSDHLDLMAYCQKKGILFLSTPFDEDSATFLFHLDMPMFKIPSGEITNLPFLRHVAGFKKPIILSTGMATFEEIDQALLELKEAPVMTLLHCTSAYPCPYEEVHLNVISRMMSRFNCAVGYSDHTLGSAVAIAAVAKGATVIEKHLTLDCSLPGPDHQASMMPDDFKKMVADIRIVEKALGSFEKQVQPSEWDTKAVARKSIVTLHPISKGQLLTMNNVAIKRPGTGIPPAFISQVLGKKAKHNLTSDYPLSWDDLDG